MSSKEENMGWIACLGVGMTIKTIYAGIRNKIAAENDSLYKRRLRDEEMRPQRRKKEFRQGSINTRCDPSQHA